MVTGATLLLLALIAWRTWRPAATSGEWAVEWSAVTILTVLLAPVCWKQHLVVMCCSAVFPGRSASRLKSAAARRAERRAVADRPPRLLLRARRSAGPRPGRAAGRVHKTFTLAALLAPVSVRRRSTTGRPVPAHHAAVPASRPLAGRRGPR